MNTKRHRIFGMDIDVVTMRETVELLGKWAKQRDMGCRYVVTPNVDHAVMFQANQQLREAYRGASLILADGMPILLASRLLGKPLPERVAGSDLVPAFFDATSSERPLRVFLLGAGPGVAERASGRIHDQWSHVEVVGTYCPPLGFEYDERQNSEIVSAVNKTNAELLVIGLGAPKQEFWIQRHCQSLQVPVALCVGATIDFLAGEKKRAPRWMRRTGLEWLYRCASEPRRLAARYARDAMLFPQLVWQEWRGAGIA